MPPTSIRFIQTTIERLRRNPITNRMIRNSGYMFSGNTLSAALSMVQSILAARLLGVEVFGVLGTVTQFASVINRFTSFRMSELVVSYIGEFSSKGKEKHSAAVFKIAGLTEMVSTLVAFMILVAFAPLGAKYLAKDPGTVGIFVLYGVSILANIFAESATGLLQIYDRFRAIAVITVSQGIITLILIFFAFVKQGDLRDVILAYLIGKVFWAVSISLTALWVAHRQWGKEWWKAPLALIADRKKDLIRFAISTNLSGTINFVTRDSDLLWLSALSSPLQVGYYKVAKAFMNVLLVPVTPLISTTYREVSREVAGNRWANVKYLLRSGTLVSAAWTLPASLVLVFAGPWLVRLYGPDFLPAYTVLLILLIGVIAVNLIYWGRSVLLPLGIPDYPTKVGFIAAATQIIGMLLLVPQWGASAMAGMMSVFFLINAITLFWKTILELRRVEADITPEPGI
jgi:O-antigen/teichoic acid export membrane protein